TQKPRSDQHAALSREWARNGQCEILRNIKIYEEIESMLREDIVFEEKHTPIVAKTFFHRKKIADIEPAVIHKAMRLFDTFKFNVLKSHYPNLKSVNEFAASSDYLGGIELVIESVDERLKNEHLYAACLQALRRVASVIAGIEVDYEGTKEFYASRMSEVFKNKKVYITDPHGDGVGVSQNAGMVSNELRLDLSGKDWFVFDDNYGTSEEKRFIAYFNTIASDLKKKYEEVYLIRNERQLAIYSFEHGERFEPDYLLFLLKKDFDGMEQYQIFIEPKGGQLLLSDAWKEEFLLQLEKEAVPVKVFVDDNHYRIWGFPFYNAEQRDKEFKAAMARVL
ncbi:MAG: hypothetical protein N2491_13870, partial [Negativicutes bacterium]|nr:hypothetical protein [Negativicutes bacterium]